MKNKIRTTKITTPGGYQAKVIACFREDEERVSWALQFKDGEIEHENEMEVEAYLDGTWLPYEETIQHRVPYWLEDALWTKLFPRLGMRKED